MSDQKTPPRIVQIVVPRTTVRELAAADRRKLLAQPPAGETDWAWSGQDNPPAVVAPPWADRDPRYLRIRAVLQEIGVKWWEERDVTKNYALVWTNAAKVYDYGWTLPVGTLERRGAQLRVVAIPEKQAEGQIMRYFSGLAAGGHLTPEELATL